MENVSLAMCLLCESSKYILNSGIGCAQAYKNVPTKRNMKEKKTGKQIGSRWFMCIKDVLRTFVLLLVRCVVSK